MSVWEKVTALWDARTLESESNLCLEFKVMVDQVHLQCGSGNGLEYCYWDIVIPSDLWFGLELTFLPFVMRELLYLCTRCLDMTVQKWWNIRVLQYASRSVPVS